MGSIFQVLIVIGIIVFAIARQANESAEKKKKRAKGSIPDPYRPVTTMENDKKPSPAPFLSYDHEQGSSFPISTGTSQTKSPKKSETQKESITASPTAENPDAEQEFNIHSTEDVRRGIIWSEILNRKY